MVGGAPLHRYEEIKKRIKAPDFVIYCDSGLYHRGKLGYAPSLILGDFDSHPRPAPEERSGAELIVLPCEKDDTDSMAAVKEALARGYEEFILTGVTGGRIDQTLANLSLLFFLEKQGKSALLLDDTARLRVVSPARPAEIADACRYFSLLALDGPAEGVSITGAKYPLQNAIITWENSFAVSNEVLPGGKARVSLANGLLLLAELWE